MRDVVQELVPHEGSILSGLPDSNVETAQVMAGQWTGLVSG